MTDQTDHAHPDLTADPADDLMARFADVLEAFDALEHAALNIQCPGCDPTGETTAAVRGALAERFGLDVSAAYAVLDRAADVRTVMLGLLAEPCPHVHDEDAGEEGAA